MVEECLTLFVGRYTTLCTARYEGDFPWKTIKVTPFPWTIGRSVFERKKMWLPIMGNIPNTLLYKEFPIVDPYNQEATGKKIRVVFMDLLFNHNHEITIHIPAMEESREVEVRNLKTERDFYEDMYFGLLSDIKAHDPDWAEKTSLRLARWSKKLKTEFYSFGETAFNQQNQQR